MIGAGKDLTITQKGTVDTMSYFYCPTGKKKKKEEEECKTFLTAAMAATAGKISDDGKADEFATSIFYTACADIYTKCKEEQGCFNDSIRAAAVNPEGKAPFGVLFGGTEYITFVDFLNRMAKKFGADCDGECIGPLKKKAATLPKVLYDYNSELLAGKNGPFASETRRLYNDAMAAPGADDADKVAAAIVDFTKKRLETTTGLPPAEQKAAKDNALDALAKTVIMRVDTTTPDVIFTDEVPPVLWGDIKAPAVQKENRRRVFLDALDIYKSKPKAEDFIAADTIVAFAALGEAIKKAIGTGDNLSKVDVTDVVVDDTGKATEVKVADVEPGEAPMSPPIAAAVPEALMTGILGSSADDPYAQAAIGELWRRIVAKNAKAGTDAKLQEKITANLFSQLRGLSAFDIALISVKKVNADGTVEIDPAPRALVGGDSEKTLRELNVDIALAVLLRLRQKYDDMMATDAGKEMGKEKVAAKVAEEAMHMIKHHSDGPVAGAQEFFGAEMAKAPSNKPGSGFIGHILIDGATNFDAGSAFIDIEAGYKWDLGSGWYGKLLGGPAGGAKVDPYGQVLNPNSDSAFLLRKSPNNQKSLLLMKALATVGRERDNEVNYSLDIGIDRDDDWLEANKAIARANIEAPVVKKEGKAFTTLSAYLGGGWLFEAFNLDPDVEDQSKVGGGFVDIGAVIESKLWKGAQTALALDFTHAVDKQVSDVVAVAAKFKQTLAEDWDLKLKGIYGNLFNDAAPAPYDSVHIGIVSPAVAWYAAKVSEKLYISPEATYRLIATNVTGETHSAGLDLYLRTRADKHPGDFTLGLGGSYNIRTAEDDVPIDTADTFDTGDGDSVPTAITPEPGADGWLLQAKLKWWW